MLLSVSLQECYNKVEAEFMERRTPQVSQQSGKLVFRMFVEDLTGLALQGYSQRCNQLSGWLPGRSLQYSGEMQTKVESESESFEMKVKSERKSLQDVGERLSAVHKAAGESELDLCTALDTCVHAEKIRELVVNEKSSLRLTKENISKSIRT